MTVTITAQGLKTVAGPNAPNISWFETPEQFESALRVLATLALAQADGSEFHMVRVVKTDTGGVFEDIGAADLHVRWRLTRLSAAHDSTGRRCDVMALVNLINGHVIRVRSACVTGEPELEGVVREWSKDLMLLEEIPGDDCEAPFLPRLRQAQPDEGCDYVVDSAEDLATLATRARVQVRFLRPGPFRRLL